MPHGERIRLFQPRSINALRGRCTRNVKPLVNARVDGRRSLVLALGNVERAAVGALGRVGNCRIDTGNISYRLQRLCHEYLQAEVLLGSLASGELLPGLGTLTDNVHGILLVLALAGEGELVLGLAIGNLVDAEPFVRGAEETRQVALDVLDIVQLRSQWVVHVDDHDLPVRLALVEQCHDTEHLDLDDLTGLGDQLANLAHVQWVVVALGLGLLVYHVGVFPCLQHSSAFVLCADIGVGLSYLGEGTVVPEVALVREAVPHVAELALLDVLLDGVERLLLGDLFAWSAYVLCSAGMQKQRGNGRTHIPPSWRWSSGAPQQSC
jgi:hypothetical protein